MLGLVVGTAGCAPSGGTPPPSEGSATLGSDGGTVFGPDGVTVEVPPGALSSEVTLRVARDGTGAPDVPSDVTPLGAIYQFTPHGTSFDAPVTVSLPIDRDALPEGTEPMLMFAEPGEEWVYLTQAEVDGDFIRAPVLGFSYGNVWIGNANTTGPRIIEYALVAPSGLPTYPNTTVPLVQAPTVITLQMRVDPDFAGRRCLDAPTIELARATKTVTDSTPPPSWAYQPVASHTLGTLVSGRLQTEFDVSLDHTDNGTVWFIGKFDCTRRPVTGGYDGYSWFLFGYHWVRVDVPVPVGAPVITQQPQSTTVPDGTPVELTVEATAPDSLSIHWQRSDDGGTTWTTVQTSGATYLLDPATAGDDGALFRARVCNALGVQLQCVDSDVATLTVTPFAAAPFFTTEPTDSMVVVDQTASLLAVATGVPAPSIQWYRVGTPDVAVGTVCAAGAVTTACPYTTPVLSLADSGSQYYAVADSTSGQSTSAVATVTVSAGVVAPRILVEPADQTVTDGQPVTFSVLADGTAPLSYQWQRDGADLIGENGASLDLASVMLADDGSVFSVVVSNGEGFVPSRDALLTVGPSGPTWTPAGAIDTLAGDADYPDVAIDANGNATVVWAQDEGSEYGIYASRNEPGAGWSVAAPIESLAGNAGQPVVAAGGSGGAMAAFASLHAYAAAYDGGWTAETPLDGLAYAASGPAVAMSASGDAIVVWQQFDGSHDNIYASYYEAGVGWGPGVPIETGSGAASNPQVAFDASGNAIAVWRQNDGSTYSIYASRLTVGAGWDPAVPVETLTTEALTPYLAVGANGNAVVAWGQSDGGSYPVYASYYTAGVGWSGEVLLDAGTPYGTNPQVAIDASGNAVAAFRQYDGMHHGIFVRRFEPGGGWSAVDRVESMDGSDAWDPDVAMTSSGEATVVFMQWNGPGFGIYASVFTPGGGWSAAALVAQGTNDVSGPRVAVSDAGRTVVVWRQNAGSGNDIQAAILE